MSRNMERTKTFKRLIDIFLHRPDHTICSEEDVVTKRDRHYLDRMVENGYCWYEEDTDSVGMWVLRPLYAMYFVEKAALKKITQGHRERDRRISCNGDTKCLSGS